MSKLQNTIKHMSIFQKKKKCVFTIFVWFYLENYLGVKLLRKSKISNKYFCKKVLYAINNLLYIVNKKIFHFIQNLKSVEEKGPFDYT